MPIQVNDTGGQLSLAGYIFQQNPRLTHYRTVEETRACYEDRKDAKSGE